jgi:hypothetical protein
MPEKITSLRELKERIKEMRTNLHQPIDDNDDVAWWIVDADDLDKVIDEFEAGLVERADGVYEDWTKLQKLNQQFDARLLQGCWQELRRILGEVNP